MKYKNIRMIFFGLILVGIISSCRTNQYSSMNNMVARMEFKEAIEGVCDNTNIIAILPIAGNGQTEAVAPKTDEEITSELNSKLSFLKDKSKYSDKGMVGLIVNCKGELVKCKMDNKTKSPELDSQIVAVFAEMKTWTAGKLHNNSIDTSVLYSFTIDNGKISL